MTHTIRLRPVVESDLAQLSRIMFDTWYASDAQYADQQTCEHLYSMARFDTAHYLETSTHALVAEEVAESVILGVSMWRNDADIQRYATSQKAIAQKELDRAYTFAAQDSHFAAMLEDFLADAQRTIDLEKPAAKVSQAELRLFMMDAKARGKGVGKRLLAAAEGSMRESGASQYYLYTDSTCDYGFYDYRGMERVAEQHRVPGPGGSIVDKYIYVGQL
ncbi:GNAT family N-acetyltransferase [Alloscardovia macacae]|uniref:GNAT family acetyltransferase n=1 Tax=Alloscardovia macacae TaxID=1160091 RepID=A0A261F582_9BIFI|nr:GNAT family N-acetyltransferase [Alloscardovia macacae]OZG54235.1 GNAT family acetyltransferase [Alloscardovia macacae]